MTINEVFIVKNFSYENQGANTFLVYSVGEENGVDPVSLGMLTNNKIPGMAKVLFMQMDKSKIIKYNISAKVNLKQFFSGIVNKAKLLSVFTGIVETVLSAEDYMIDIKTIIMDSEYIFIDTRTGELSLICVPVNDSNEIYKNPIDLFKTIMFSTSFDQTENCDYVAKLINYVNSTQNFSFANFRMLVDSLRTGTHSSVPSAPAQVHVQEQKTVVQPVVNVTPTPVVAPQQPVQRSQSVVTPAMEVPQKKVEVPSVEQSQSDEKEITMFQLLMHYSKENAEKYKAQKSSKQSAPAEKSKSSIMGSLFTVPGKTSPAKTENKPQSQAVKSAGFEIPGQTPSPIATAPVVQKTAQETASKTAQQDKPSAISSMPVYQTQAAPKEQSMNFGETTVLGGGVFGETTLLSETTVLGQQQKPRVNAYLVRYRNKEKIIINKPVFRIGKERSYVDYFIGDNTTISRSHANIINRDDEFYIVDTNSTNHTYVDGLMLQSNVETKLTNGCKIRLANEDFEFKVY